MTDLSVEQSKKFIKVFKYLFLCNCNIKGMSPSYQRIFKHEIFDLKASQVEAAKGKDTSESQITGYGQDSPLSRLPKKMPVKSKNLVCEAQKSLIHTQELSPLRDHAALSTDYSTLHFSSKN